MKKLAEFLAYNNAVPIAFGILFLGAAGAAAATPEVRDAVVGSEQVVQSIDNSRIVNADIENYPFTVQIIGVQEDDTNYYVLYTLQTIDLVDSVWQDVLYERELVVEKAALDGRDLGLYATEQVAQVRDSERRRLLATQEFEKEIGVSQKVIATVYSGLIGQFLDSSSDTLPNYVPVVVEPEPVVAGVQSQTSGDPNDPVPPAISIIGESIVRHPKGQPYTDLGALVTDNLDGEIGYEIFLDNQQVEVVEIDTNTLWAYVITYHATDSAGNVSEARREVVVEEITTPVVPPPTPEPEPAPEETATSTPETEEPDPVEPEPEPTEEEPAPEETTEPPIAEEETATSTPGE